MDDTQGLQQIENQYVKQIKVYAKGVIPSVEKTVMLIFQIPFLLVGTNSEKRETENCLMQIELEKRAREMNAAGYMEVSVHNMSSECFYNVLIFADILEVANKLVEYAITKRKK